MADDPKDVTSQAERLRDFIVGAQRETSGSMPAADPPGERRDPLLQTCEECLGKLTRAERGELDHIVGKMLGALGGYVGPMRPP
jgi:hypothetical protein